LPAVRLKHEIGQHASSTYTQNVPAFLHDIRTSIQAVPNPGTSLTSPYQCGKSVIKFGDLSDRAITHPIV
jgi:hypothetical protein